jgi:hypothetical protein
MSDLSQKTNLEMSDKDRQFEKLLSNAFRMLSTQHSQARIINPENKVSRNASDAPGVMQCK